MKNFLVTGGAGFIGSSLVEKLLLNNAINVTVIDNLSASSEQDIKHLQGKANFRLVKGDVLDSVVLKREINAADIILHLSANPEVRIGLIDTKIDYEQNIKATYNVLEAMRKSPSCKKIIFTSSSTVYGEIAIMPTKEEHSAFSPISLYGASKLACEAMISGYCHMFDMSGIVLRLANIIGPRSHHGVIYDFLKKLEADPSRLEILGDGKQNKSYLYIEDCINAIIHLMSNDSTYNVFNIGSADQVTVLEIAEIIFRERKQGNVSINYTGGVKGAGWKGDVKEMLLDCEKANTQGWSPKYSSAEAVRMTVRGMIKKRS